MKKIRRGFTLVELLIVIGVIGTLSSMAMMGGTEATNIAKANKIIEEFKIIGAAMNMYYADNRSNFEAGAVEGDLESGIEAQSLEQKILAGIGAYMKDTKAVVAKSPAVGKYSISVEGSEWWLTYKLEMGGTKLAKILANKAAEESLKKETKHTTTVESNTTYSTAEAYTSDGDTVCWQVR